MELLFDSIPDWGAHAAQNKRVGPMTLLVILLVEKAASGLAGTTWLGAKRLSEMTTLKQSDVEKALRLAAAEGYFVRHRELDEFGGWNGWRYEATYPAGTPHLLRPVAPGNTRNFSAKSMSEVSALLEEALDADTEKQHRPPVGPVGGGDDPGSRGQDDPVDAGTTPDLPGLRDG